jgi:hypothetical protein
MDLIGALELQKVAEYRRARKTARAAGIGGLFFGGLAVFVGASALGQNILNLVLIMIGLLLVADGIWNFARPSAGGVIVDGFAFVVIGLWNIFITCFNILAAIAVPGAQPDVKWGVMGVVQIAYGIYRFVGCRRFAEAFRVKPDANDLAQLDELVKKIQKTKPKDAEGLVLFQVETFFGRQPWKGQLTDNGVLFVSVMMPDVIVARREEVHIEVKGKVVLGKTRKATIRIREHTLKVLIPPDSLAAIEAWKSRPAQQDVHVEPEGSG